MKDCQKNIKQSKIRCQLLHTLHIITISVPQLWAKVQWRENWPILYTPEYYFIQVKSTVKTNYICTRGQFGPLHICVGESPKCCIAVVVFEPHNLLSAVRLSPHTVGQNRPQFSSINLFACLFIWRIWICCIAVLVSEPKKCSVQVSRTKNTSHYLFGRSETAQ